MILLLFALYLNPIKRNNKPKVYKLQKTRISMVTNNDEYMKNWIAKNRDKRRLYQKRYRERHKEQIKKHMNLPYIKQREKARHRIYHIQQKENNYERPHIDIIKSAGLSIKKCWDCGKEEFKCKKRLHLHHKNQNREDSRLEN